MFRTVFVLGALSVGLWVASSHAGTPFGGDDLGFITSNADDAKCEATGAKLVVKTIPCIQKCQIKRAQARGSNANATTEELCEGSCHHWIDGVDVVLGHLFRHPGFNCPAIVCLEDSSVGLNLRTITRRLIIGSDDAGWAAINALTYCDASSGTPFGSGDSGFVPPPNSPIKNCELKVGAAVSKLALCDLNCSALRASGMLPDEAAEESCESTCTTGFTGKVSSLKGCPPCLDATSIASATESLIDGTYVPAIYCASPSGAFVQ